MSERLLRVAIGSTIGSRASENQDAVGIDGWELHTGSTAYFTIDLDAALPHVIALADGMGGIAGGRRAAEVAAETISGVILSDGYGVAGESSIDALDGAVTTTRERLDGMAQSDGSVGSLGTTVVALAWNPGADALVVQIGDSMAYRMVGEYLSAIGEPHRAGPGPDAGKLTDHLGPGQRSRPIPKVLSLPWHEGTRVVLCTDGVWDVIARQPAGFARWEKLFQAQHFDAGPVMRATIAQVIELGAPDNATIVIIDEIAAAKDSDE
jgi:protein phosphatase